MIITVTPNPAVDKSITIQNLKIDAVNRTQTIRQDAGGKGINVSKVINAMGENSVAMGIVGGASGQFILNELSSRQIEKDFVLFEGTTRQNLKIFDTVNNTYTDINEAGENVGQEVFNELYLKVKNRAVAGDIVVLAGRATSDIKEDAFASWATELKKGGVKVIVDMDGQRLKNAIHSQPYAIKPNEFELAEIFSLENVEVQTLAKTALKIAKEQVELVVVSLGARGSLFVKGNDCLWASAPKVQAVSTVGAGDSVTAGIAIALEKGYSLKELATFATAIGTAKVLCEGSSPPSKEMVEGFLSKIKIEQIF